MSRDRSGWAAVRGWAAPRPARGPPPLPPRPASPEASASFSSQCPALALQQWMCTHLRTPWISRFPSSRRQCSLQPPCPLPWLEGALWGCTIVCEGPARALQGSHSTLLSHAGNCKHCCRKAKALLKKCSCRWRGWLGDGTRVRVWRHSAACSPRNSLVAPALRATHLCRHRQPAHHLPQAPPAASSHAAPHTRPAPTIPPPYPHLPCCPANPCFSACPTASVPDRQPGDISSSRRRQPWRPPCTPPSPQPMWRLAVAA